MESLKMYNDTKRYDETLPNNYIGLSLAHSNHLGYLLKNDLFP